MKISEREKRKTSEKNAGGASRAVRGEASLLKIAWRLRQLELRSSGNVGKSNANPRNQFHDQWQAVAAWDQEQKNTNK